MRLTRSYLLGFCLPILMQCTSKENTAVISYPEPTPDSVALRFLPGIVTTGSLDFNSAFSQDGKTFYFCRGANGKWKMYTTSFDGKRWTTPSLVPFDEAAYSQADPFFAPDGTLYFISNRPRDESDTLRDFDICFVRPLGNNLWSLPENLEIVNSDSSEYFVSFADNGNLYFASSRPGGYGLHDIYVSRIVNGKYQSPENLGSAINAAESDHDPFISGNEEFLIFTSENRKDTHGEADLYFSERAEDKSWSAAKNMGSRINTSTYEYCPYLSPDSRYFFFSSEYDVKWIKANYLPMNISK